MSGSAMDGVTVVPVPDVFPVRWVTRVRFDAGYAEVEGRDADGVEVAVVLPEPVVRERFRLVGKWAAGDYMDLSGGPVCTDPPLPPVQTVHQPSRVGVETDLSEIIGDEDANRIVSFEDFGSTMVLTEQCDMNFCVELDVDQVRRLADWLQAWVDRQGADAPERVTATVQFVDGVTAADFGLPAALIEAARKVLDITPEQDAAVMNWDPETD